MLDSQLIITTMFPAVAIQVKAVVFTVEKEQFLYPSIE